MPPTPYISPIVRTLIYHRIARGLSQPALAKLLRISLGTMAAWEQGRRMPTLPHLEMWANELNVDLIVVARI